jgi:carbonic anhydrase/acetyltransferase-like protein (isoleucine patch superfamily)
MAIYALGDQIPDIHPDAYVHPDATIIGSVTIGAFASIWPQVVLRGDQGTIDIGANTNVQDGSILHTTPYTPTIIGANSAVGHNVHIEGAVIGSGCLIASGSVVLNASVIADGGIVGAGAVLSYGFQVAAGEMALGVPAKVRENKSMTPEGVQLIVDTYLGLAARFKKELRKLD